MILDGDYLSKKEYNTVIGIVLLWGLLLSAAIAKLTTNYFATWNLLVLIIVYFVCSIAGVLIAHRSDDPRISFLGYNMVVAPAGMILSVILRTINPGLIIRALLITAGVTVVMIIAANLRPKLFLSLGKVLWISLIAVIIIEVIGALAGWFEASWWDAIVAAIFSLYIGYDWARAQQFTHTLDGAIDASVDIYLDILNLFLRIVGYLSDDD